MTKANFSKPNYQYWSMTETWSFNASAFLLNGIDPHKYRSIRLYEIDIPHEFEKAQQTLLLLKSVPWDTRYKEYYFKNLGVHPAAVITIAKNKGLKIPVVLRKSIESRYKNEIIKISSAFETGHLEKEEKDVLSDVGSRERKTWQLATGLLIRLYAKKIGKLSSDDQVTISASQLLQQMLDESDRLRIDTDGIKSFDRKITKALELIEEEKNI